MSLSSAFSQPESKIEIYLATSTPTTYEEVSLFKEIDSENVKLDSILLNSNDLLTYNDTNFEFTLTKEASVRLKKMNLDHRVFCITVNGEKELAGVFWPCHLSVGMTGFVSFNLELV